MTVGVAQAVTSDRQGQAVTPDRDVGWSDGHVVTSSTDGLQSVTSVRQWSQVEESSSVPSIAVIQANHSATELSLISIKFIVLVGKGGIQYNVSEQDLHGDSSLDDAIPVRDCKASKRVKLESLGLPSR